MYGSTLSLTSGLDGTGWSTPRPGRLLPPPRREPLPIVQKAGWAPGPVLTSAENVASTGIRSPDRPVCSQPLCPMRYPRPFCSKSA